MNEGDNKANNIGDNKAVSMNTLNDNTPVTVSRSVTIFRKEESSAYFKRNAKFMPEGKNKIGSGINSINRMKSNMAEIDAYMPVLLGMDKSDPKYREQVDLWFNNISKSVPETGLNLEIGFVYNNQSAKKSIEDVEEDIFKKFNSAKKVTSKERDEAIDLRDREIIELEKTKYRYGFPININDYILWRYCLVYSDVANDIALINKAGGIRFYIYDSVREKHKEKIQFEIRKKATAIFVKLFEMPDKVTNMLWVDKGNTVDISKLEDYDKVRMIENMSKANPSNFINLYSDVNLDIKATIERMIHFGVLKRLPNSSIIVDDFNDIVGNTMDEAITFFKNEERNKASITRFKAKLRDYNNG